MNSAPVTTNANKAAQTRAIARKPPKARYSVAVLATTSLMSVLMAPHAGKVPGGMLMSTVAAPGCAARTSVTPTGCQTSSLLFSSALFLLLLPPLDTQATSVRPDALNCSPGCRASMLRLANPLWPTARTGVSVGVVPSSHGATTSPCNGTSGCPPSSRKVPSVPAGRRVSVLSPSFLVSTVTSFGKEIR